MSEAMKNIGIFEQCHRVEKENRKLIYVSVAKLYRWIKLILLNGACRHTIFKKI